MDHQQLAPEPWLSVYSFTSSLCLNGLKSHYNANTGIVKQNRNACVLSKSPVQKFGTEDSIIKWNLFSIINPNYDIVSPNQNQFALEVLRGCTGQRLCMCVCYFRFQKGDHERPLCVCCTVFAESALMSSLCCTALLSTLM